MHQKIHFHISSLCNSFQVPYHHHSFIIRNRHCLQHSCSVQCSKIFLSNCPYASLMYNHLVNDLHLFIVTFLYTFLSMCFLQHLFGIHLQNIVKTAGIFTLCFVWLILMWKIYYILILNGKKEQKKSLS